MIDIPDLEFARRMGNELGDIQFGNVARLVRRLLVALFKNRLR
ncbi:hypothetical protein ACQZ4Q_23080 [Agrobacterium vitis]